MSLTWPLEMLTTVTFAELQGRTQLTLRWNPKNASDVERDTFHGGRGGMRQGWTGSFEPLEAYLAKA